jgi:hypothetical protein
MKLFRSEKQALSAGYKLIRTVQGGVIGFKNLNEYLIYKGRVLI